MYIYLLPLVALALIISPVVYSLSKNATVSKAKTAFKINLCIFAGVMILALALPFAIEVKADADVPADAQTTVSETASESSKMSSDGLGYLAAALATGLGSIGCGIAVAAAAPAAIGAVSEEPKAFSKALIFVALGEGVALYGFLISFMILGKLG